MSHSKSFIIMYHLYMYKVCMPVKLLLMHVLSKS